MVGKILDVNPDLSEAYFLSYLNCVRMRDYCGAIYNLNRAFHEEDPIENNTPFRVGPGEEGNKGFRSLLMTFDSLRTIEISNYFIPVSIS